MTKIAFCFLTYGDIHQGALWKAFFHGNEDKYNVYVHNKMPVTDEFFNQRIIDNIIETRYGTITQLKASINLFEAAWQNRENQYFVLVSGSCLPLYNFETVFQKIFSLNATLFKPMGQELGRLKYMKDQSVFDASNFKTQATWMVMKRNDLPIILQNEMTDSVFGDRVFGVDHHYFINLFGLFNMRYAEFPLTWDNWAEPDVRKNPYHYGPKTYEYLDAETIAEARAEGCLFLRKVSENCTVDVEFAKEISAGRIH